MEAVTQDDGAHRHRYARVFQKQREKFYSHLRLNEKSPLMTRVERNKIGEGAFISVATVETARVGKPKNTALRHSVKTQRLL